jgi:aryl-alcohol dehydrogenase-like predicted oxidoreductase
METTTLGRTGLTVSVAGLGCGGDSRIGMGKGMGRADSVKLIREAHDLGVTLFDTARGYGTEEILGEALQAMPRDKVVVTTKTYGRYDTTAAELTAEIDESLRALQTDYVDVLMLHALHPDDYDHAIAELVPAMQRARDAGKCRLIGVTETAPKDPETKMLSRAVHDDVWQVMMLAFHMMNQGARQRVFPHTQANGIGTLIMFAVRFLFSMPGKLQETCKELAAEGRLPQAIADDPDPLGFLIHEGGARDLLDAAYRFARHEPGSDVVLFGTSSRDHLKANIESINRPPLPQVDIDRLAEMFHHLEGVGLVFTSRGLDKEGGPANRPDPFIQTGPLGSSRSYP